MMSGRPTKPVVHWLSRPGGGWSEVEEIDADRDSGTAEESAAESTEEPKQEAPPRRLGFGRRPARIQTTNGSLTKSARYPEDRCRPLSI
jgi:hypothetical protein